jgi:predicted nucleic-acid-binding Zn-ribbon protein
MNESATYSVVLSGDLKTGFEPEEVVEAFAKLFKLPPEKAGSIVGTRFVLKREVELKVAKTYQAKLATIGVDVKLEQHGGIDDMALEPMGSVDDEQVVPLAQDEMICPKCELRQARADECSGCGVFVHKVLPKAAESEAADEAVPALEPREAVSAAIGSDVKLNQPGGIDDLALEPMGSVESVDGEQYEQPTQGEMICPKCELRQAKADKCTSCGVYMHKVMPKAAEPEAADEAVPAAQPREAVSVASSAAIGGDIKLKQHDDLDDLALEPVESADGELVEPLAQDEMVCPKCELRQARADQCSSCGVFMHKVMPKAAEPETADEAVPTAQPHEAASIASTAAIGGDFKLKQPDGLDELALEPVGSEDGELGEPLVQDEMICPKCESRQARADECACCGEFVHKVLP